MKIRTLSIFATAAVVALTACGGGDEAESGDTGGDTATVAPAPMPAPLPAPMPMDTTGMDTMSHDTMADTTAM